MAHERILVVDDNPANCKLVSFLLKTAGYSVRTATTADEAIAAIGLEVPELILMDLQLPGMDGLTLTRQLKLKSETRATLIVAFTAYAMLGDEARARAAGCDAYITKPINTRTFPSEIRDLLDRQQQDAT